MTLGVVLSLNGTRCQEFWLRGMVGLIYDGSSDGHTAPAPEDHGDTVMMRPAWYRDGTAWWVVGVVVTTLGTIATLVSPMLDVVPNGSFAVVVKCLLEIWVAIEVCKAVPDPLVGSAVTALKVPLVKVVVAVRAWKGL